MTNTKKVTTIVTEYSTHTNIMSKTKQSSGLATVQNLYVMQFQLMGYLQSGMRTENQVKEAKQCLREFSNLLGDADPSYMGGEDVYETLEQIQNDMSTRLKARSVRSRAAKKSVVKKASTKKKQ